MKFYEKNWFVILMLVLLFPIGLFLMWRYKDWSKKTKWIITGIIGILFIFAMVDQPSAEEKLAEEKAQQEERDKREAEKAQLKKEKEAEKKAKKKEEQKLKAEEEAKEQKEKEDKKKAEKEKEEKEKAEEVKTFVDEESGIKVFDQLKDFALTKNTLVSSFSLEMSNVLKEHKDELDNGALFRLAVPLEDTYGNEENEYVLAVYYTKETIDKINVDNWPNLVASGLYDTADAVLVHPAIKDNKHAYNKDFYGEAPFILIGSIGEKYEH